MTNLTAAQVTTWYLYGQATTPTNLAHENLIRPPINQGFPQLEQDVPSYMTTGPGRFAIGLQFESVSRFFQKDTSGAYVWDVPPGAYVQSDFALNSALNTVGHTRSITFSNWQFDDGAGDYAERSYIWGTVGFEIINSASFVVTATGERYIDNFLVKPYLPDAFRENFDFVGGDLAGQFGNVQHNIDPSKIGMIYGDTLPIASIP